MERSWTLAEFTTYLRTWSAVARFSKEKGFDPVAALEVELAPFWHGKPRKVSWPLSGRLGRVG